MQNKSNWKRLKGCFLSTRFDHNTPDKIFNELNKEFGFTLDACATKENAKVSSYYSPEIDGLSQDWRGRIFMNPPYGREITKWIKKAYEETKVKGNSELVVCLLPSRTDTSWWHEYCMKADEIRFFRGRIQFIEKKSAPFPSCLVIFKRVVMNADNKGNL